MHINLKNKHILITGGSRGIGRAIAHAMVDCGAKVAIQYHQNTNMAKKTARELGPKAILFQADLSEAINVSSLFYNVLKKMDHIDVIINNAGLAIGSDPSAEDMQWANDWLKTMDVNLNAVGLLCKKSIEHFQERGGGIIINIASRAAFRGDTKDYMAYAASKGGVVALTKSIARSYGKENIKAFVVAPGLVRTDMTRDFINKNGEDYISKNISLNKLTEPKDIAPLVAFLASGMADHATGATFDVNAGSYLH
jgi:NAD(P)-dependent dehydrogenase (short-subunit alcohol dehydrogenase family)